MDERLRSCRSLLRFPGHFLPFLSRPGIAALKAGIAHYQFATIHPSYYDGNGRTARLLTTLILHQGGMT